jgi:hypothetical protein
MTTLRSPHELTLEPVAELVNDTINVRLGLNVREVKAHVSKREPIDHIAFSNLSQIFELFIADIE